MREDWTMSVFKCAGGKLVGLGSLEWGGGGERNVYSLN